jgi:hypothetical protein
MRALTRPLGSDAVDRQHVSGWSTPDPGAPAAVNHAWN